MYGSKQERALIYKTLVLTGLRKGELASITVGQVVLDAAMPYLILNVAGAMESLPALPLWDGRQTEANVLSATGTDDSTASQFAPGFAPTTGKTGTLQSIVDKIANAAEESSDADAVDVSTYPVKEKDPLTTAVNGLRRVEPKGIEPSTSWMQTRRSPN